MKQLALLAVFVMVTAFGGATLASADCAYHKSQAALDKVDSTKSVATAAVTDKTDASQLKIVQVTKPAETKTEAKN